jgi:hypothetical protein
MKHGSNTDKIAMLDIENASADFIRDSIRFLSVFDPCFIRGLIGSFIHLPRVGLNA